MKLLPEEQRESNLKKLPEVCYAQMPDNPSRVVLLKRGERGYWEAQPGPFPDEASAKAFVTEYNAKLEVTQRQMRAMLNGSLFGFEAPAADPENDFNAQ